jgi:FAD/FMN-containing dehydrogenase
MKRRDVLAAGLTLAGAALAGVRPAASAGLERVRPGAPGWPGEADWAGLNQAVGGRLAPVVMPNLADPAVRPLIGNPYYIGDTPALTQSSGWIDAWRSSPSVYAVAAESAADVAAAIRFARVHNLRLVVRGGAHSYLGASNAPDSLMIWTRHMRAITVHDAFSPAGSGAAPVPAVSLGAGCIWQDAYQAVTTGAGRYVQGGGCTTVGVTGLVQGGGFGSNSKAYGLAAASLLEAEIVTADGRVRVVNAAHDPDLFWALKGGGGGTFGVITRVTLATHELPDLFGSVRFSVHAHSGEAFRRLIAEFVDLYATSLCNPHWGEQVNSSPGNSFQVSMEFQGLTTAQARAAWKPLVDFVAANAADYSGGDSFTAVSLPARKRWDHDFMSRYAPSAIQEDKRPGAAATNFWWSGDGEQVGVFWHAYTSAWLPADLLKPENQARLVDAWFAATRHWSVGFHFNKGLAGATPEVLAASRNTAMNPDVLDAFALVIIAMAGPPAFQGMPAPSATFAHANGARVQAAMTALRAAAPATGAYVNECDYFQRDWQRAFWGDHYPRLARIKRRYDPDGLFYVHHGVGSEAWSQDGFSRIA